MEVILKLLKIDLGITHDKRDSYFLALLSAAKAELEKKGFLIDMSQVDDQILLSDYAAWVYRKRQENIPLSKNLQYRIRTRMIQARAGGQSE